MNRWTITVILLFIGLSSIGATEQDPNLNSNYESEDSPDDSNLLTADLPDTEKLTASGLDRHAQTNPNTISGKTRVLNRSEHRKTTRREKTK